MRCFTVFLFLLYGAKLFSQPVFSRLDTIHVSYLNTPLKNPWVGGFNFTEWSAIDLDLDGIKDLAVFDKTGEKIRTFKNDNLIGTPSYTHAPQFQPVFLDIVNSWAIFYDYNNDGKEDLFTYALGYGGIRVYKNTSTPGNLQFTFFKNYLKSDYLNGFPAVNTPVSGVAIPALSDIDNDGDMDVLTFESSGILFQFHKNMSMERYGIIDSLEFNVVDQCWGNAAENTCMATLNYPTCPLMRMYQQINSHKAELKIDNVLHAGSCLMCIDMDGDSDKDLVVGDVSCDSVEYFRNAGSIANAHFDLATKNFPNSTNPISQKQFPCTYFLDLNNDGKRDLIASPNIQSSENTKSVWYYNNIGTDNLPNFTFIKKSFLQDEMLEFGEGAFPTPFDFDADGDMDIVVGNFGYYAPVSVYSGKLALLQNTGTPTHPSFNVQTVDYMNLSTYNLKNMTPSFGDMDGDGDKDLIIGDATGHLTYFTNTAGPGNTANFVFTSDFSNGFLAGIDVGINAYPQIIDVDKDGLNDLLVGEYDGTLNFYENIGTTGSPVLNTVAPNFGNVRVNRPGYFEAQSTPFLFNANGSYKLLVGSERGYLYLFGNIDNNLGGSFTLIDSIYNNIREGEQLAPCLADFNADAVLDLVVGNYSGGLTYFKGIVNTNVIKENEGVLNEVNIFPNPASTELRVNFNRFNTQLKEITIYDELGREIQKTQSSEIGITLDVSYFESGFYILQVKVQAENNQHYQITKKILKQ